MKLISFRSGGVRPSQMAVFEVEGNVSSVREHEVIPDPYGVLLSVVKVPHNPPVRQRESAIWLLRIRDPVIAVDEQPLGN